ncbi:Tc5 transposase DNA-binding domain [Popillia japonica]|uniref:Tc5 transposase DNA-binding domain n=1 Tax=Popillia japonica TaxID=7064 RepID=A0AAW1MH07_POPJA
MSSQGDSVRKITKTRKVLTLSEKNAILDKLSRGETCASVNRMYGMDESSIRTIRKHQQKIRASIIASASASTKTTSYSGNEAIEKMEKALVLWIETQTSKRISLDNVIIREKAKSLYHDITLRKDQRGTDTINDWN